MQRHPAERPDKKIKVGKCDQDKKERLSADFSLSIIDVWGGGGWGGGVRVMKPEEGYSYCKFEATSIISNNGGNNLSYGILCEPLSSDNK